MAIHLPSHLLLSRHNVYYFRIAVPRRLRSIVKQRELRVSLRTGERRVAIAEARKWKVRFDDWFETISRMKLREPRYLRTVNGLARYEVWVEVPQAPGHGHAAKAALVHIPAGKDIGDYSFRLNDDGSVDAVAHQNGTDPQLEVSKRESGESLPHSPSDRIGNIINVSASTILSPFSIKLHPDGSIAAIEDIPDDTTSDQAAQIGSAANAIAKQLRDAMPVASLDHQTSPVLAANKKNPRMSEALAEYLSEKTEYGNSIKSAWTQKTAQEIMSRLRIVQIYFNDPVLRTLEPHHVTAMKKAFTRTLPKGLKSDGLTHEELLAMLKKQNLKKIGDTAPGSIDLATLNQYLSRFSSFIEWCVNQGYVASNIAYKKTVGGSMDNDGESRFPWTIDELKTMFESPFFVQNMYTHPYQYWLPILALHCGARINELAQLHTGNIEQDKASGIWCLKIMADEKFGQKIKNSSAKRLIPLHKKVIELGFLDFVRHRQETQPGKSVQLFTGLTLQRDGYGKNASRWFNETFKTHFGYQANEGKVFHSLRKNYIDEMKQLLLTSKQNISEIDMVTKAIVGHKGKVDITWDHYAGKFRPEVLKPVIDELEWQIQFSPYVEPNPTLARQRLKEWTASLKGK